MRPSAFNLFTRRCEIDAGEGVQKACGQAPHFKGNYVFGQGGRAFSTSKWPLMVRFSDNFSSVLPDGKAASDGNKASETI